MINTDLRFDKRTPQTHESLEKIKWRVWYTCIIIFSLLVARSLLNAEVNASILGWVIYFLVVLAIFYNPRYGVYLTVALTIGGDYILTPWYPFPLNFSSEVSLLYFNDKLIISPLETFIAFTYVSWVGRMVLARQWKFYVGPTFWPTMFFFVFMAYGLVYGITNGGDFKIALWESRPIFYLPAMTVLAMNLLETRQHIKLYIWFVIGALCFEGIMGTVFFIEINGNIWEYEGITAHDAAIHMNSVFVFWGTLWLVKASWAKRFTLLAFLPFIALTYFATNRRSAFIALMIAAMLVGLTLLKSHRVLFFILAPLGVMLGLVYLAAFWNSGSALGQPAQAIKSVIAEDEVGQHEKNSNAYRILENTNTTYTIQNNIVSGIGFGNKFMIIAPMPDISFFEWWEYITHNSALWIWMKTGIGGFVTMVFMIGTTIMVGVRCIWRMPNDELTAIATMVTTYTVMHFIYAYVDMSWSQESMTYLGATIGLIGCMEHVVSKPVEIAERRWAWQKEQEPALPIFPIPGREALVSAE